MPNDRSRESIGVGWMWDAYVKLEVRCIFGGKKIEVKQKRTRKNLC